jgi:hypothetical protein
MCFTTPCRSAVPTGPLMVTRSARAITVATVAAAIQKFPVEDTHAVWHPVAGLGYCIAVAVWRYPGAWLGPAAWPRSCTAGLVLRA